MLRAEFVGLNGAVKMFERVNRNMVVAPTEVTRDMASAFRKRLKKNLPTNIHGQGASHNTPTPLKALLNPIRKTKGGHVVSFKRNSEFPELPELVNYGTKKSNYPQPNNPIFSQKPLGHPKNPARLFWENTLSEFEMSDERRIVNDGARKIVR